ncbi:MAG: hypothetical protein M3374_06320 [Pseudomonadota bacterium]|nr:hypothetical protein [Pseudomonadota bacterium]
MPLTLGLTGMDPATETALKAAFADANARLGGHWQLVPDQQAAHVVVDMDSMYGPMSWLRLHAAGKTVIGLTAGMRTQADHRLPQPVSVDTLAELLELIAEESGESLTAVTEPAAAEPAATPAAEPAPVPVEAVGPSVPPAGLSPAPQPQHQLPEETPTVDEEASPSTEPDMSAVLPPDVTLPAHAAAQVEPLPVPPEPPRTLLAWLVRGQLKGRVRFCTGGNALLIDADQRQYIGPAALKPLASHFEREAGDEDFEPVDEAAWDSVSAASAPQPLARLVWFGALLAGKGQLVPGFDPEARYQMLKWPQTEREYPKHFRVATAMMKGPSTLADIAAASSVPLADVTDFVNANLATGFADVEHIPEPEPEPAKPTGLFNRLRGR